MRALTVLSVAYPHAPVGPDAVGGAEQVLSLIDAGLTALGHRSLVLACRGSSAHGTLRTAPWDATGLSESSRARVRRRYRSTLEDVLRHEQIDVVHLHGLDFPHYLPRHSRIPSPPPLLATLHLPASFHPGEVHACKDVIPCCVSDSQRRDFPNAGDIRLIPNGVRLDDYTPTTGKSDVVLALGRVCPEKGFDDALRAAHRSKRRLILAGQVFPYEAHQHHFERDIVPLLDEERQFIGPVGLRRKRALLASARCLVIPSHVAETSSLVAMEAFASGTPVVARRVGALPEIVEHGRTGFLVDDVEGLADAIDRVATIDPRECRRVAEERFDSRLMVERYVALYEALVRGSGKRNSSDSTRSEDAQIEVGRHEEMRIGLPHSGREVSS